MTLNPAVSEPAVAHEPDAASAPVSAHSAFRPPVRETIESHALLRGGRELTIRHGEHEYRLRLTQNDKLILTK